VCSSDLIFEDPLLSSKKIRQIKNEAVSKLQGKEPHEKEYVKVEWEMRVPKIQMIGELYVVVVPESNLYIKRELGNCGLEIHQTLYPSHWLEGIMKITHPVRMLSGVSSHSLEHQAQKDAMPFLNRDIHGDGWETVGRTITAAEHGYHAVVHLQPFTCAPEIMANNILVGIKTALEHDGKLLEKMYGVRLGKQVPYLTFNFDGADANAGVNTRLEAFADLLWRKMVKEGLLQPNNF
jgi:hypothetical protein